MYRRVARESPHGQGSVAMLEDLLPFSRGKIFVLVLLGFVATSWIVTITLSAADATVHILENPLAPASLHGQTAAVVITIVLLLLLGGVFLLGFSEAVGVAIPLVAAFLSLNAVIAAVTISAIRYRQRWATLGFMVLTLVLLYALAENIREKPDGIAISALFIAGVIAVSLISRVTRTTELRADRIEFDERARRYITESLEYDGRLNLIANRRQAGDADEYAAKEREQRGMNPVPGRADVLFLEIDVVDPSQFSDVLKVRGVEVGGHRILRANSPAAPNALAAILLALRDATGVRPHAYFEWSEGSPVTNLFRYLFLGRGDTPPVVREIIRRVERDPARRPGIHVGG